MSHPIEPAFDDFPFAGECQAAVEAFRRWKNRLLDLAVDHPLESLTAMVLGSAWVFYLAEREVNEGVRTYDDALYYISTCLSVGYANIFPKTQIGKFVAAVVMMLGPSLTAWVVEGRLVRREGPAAAGAPEAGAIVARLDAILAELRALRAAPVAEPPAG